MTLDYRPTMKHVSNMIAVLFEQEENMLSSSLTAGKLNSVICMITLSLRQNTLCRNGYIDSVLLTLIHTAPPFPPPP